MTTIQSDLIIGNTSHESKDAIDCKAICEENSGCSLYYFDQLRERCFITKITSDKIPDVLRGPRGAPMGCRATLDPCVRNQVFL